MSVIWRPIGKLMLLLTAFLCLVSTTVLLAEQDNTLSADAVLSSVKEDPADLPGVQEALAAKGQEAAAAVEAAKEQLIDAAKDAAEPAAVVIETGIERITEPAAAPVTAPAVTEAAAEPVPAPAVTEAAAEPVAAPAVTEAAAEPVAAPAVTETAAEPVAAPAVTETAAEPVAAPSVTETAAAPAPAKTISIFDMSRLNVLAFIIILVVAVSYYTFHAQRGNKLFIRRISGLSAIEDAVGRATEMGRGILYIPGIMDMDDIQTIAGVTIMGHVAKKTAEYDTPFYAPMTRSFVMSVAQEIVKQAYLEKGRADAFRPDRIAYLTDDQFGYVAGASGIMMREKPAACFYLGTFYAESLILAETGNSVGAIQIAGTAEPSQIPFFVAACDYTLIGEELFAASAYLSKSPKEIGSLKGQDIVKLGLIAIIILGTLIVTISKIPMAQGTAFVSLADNFMRMLN